MRVATLIPAVLAALVLLSACGDGPAAKPTGPEEPEPFHDLDGRIDLGAFALEVGAPAILEKDVGLRFVLVPPGAFTMGSSASAPGHAADEMLHEVRIHDPFYVLETRVTGRAWRAFRPDAVVPDGPVTDVSHDDAVAFAEWLSDRDPDHVYRLPTEAEWELVARATTPGLEFPDMEGGALEWCADWYAPHPPQAVSDPLGPDHGEHRVVRGGTGRDHRPPETRAGEIGFRLVAELGYRGKVEVTFVSVERDAEGKLVRQVPGFPLRIISVRDRLSDRQAGRIEEWTDLDGTTPVTLHLRPGRYYAYCHVDVAGEERQGAEQKFDVEGGPHVVKIDVPPSG